MAHLFLPQSKVSVLAFLHLQTSLGGIKLWSLFIISYSKYRRFPAQLPPNATAPKAGIVCLHLLSLLKI